MNNVQSIEPFWNRVFIKVDGHEGITKGGIHIPQMSQEQKLIGEVMAVGPGYISSRGVSVKYDVKVGDKVVFGRFMGYTVRANGERYLVVENRYIEAKIVSTRLLDSESWEDEEYLYKSAKMSIVTSARLEDAETAFASVGDPQKSLKQALSEGWEVYETEDVDGVVSVQSLRKKKALNSVSESEQTSDNCG